MRVLAIAYHPDFLHDLNRLPDVTLRHVVKSEKIFRQNPLHPSLRLHRLKGTLNGLWSISVTRKDRIVFQRLEDGTAMFLSVGPHDIYRSL